MAIDLALIRQADGQVVTSTLDLLDYEDGIAVYNWTQAAYQAGTPTIETMGMRLRGDIPTITGAIDQKIRETANYFNGPDLYSVWLRAKIDAETEERKALVTDLFAQPARTMMDSVLEKTGQLNDYTLAVTRAPYWEDLDATTSQHTNQDNTAAGFEVGSFGGDVPARIRYVRAEQWQSTALNEFWVGFRTNRFGSRGNFQAEWNCGDGTTATTNGATMSDGGAANVVAGTFDSDASLIDRFYIRVGDLDCSESDQRGEFQLLMVANTGADTTCNVQVAHGVYSDDDYNTWVSHGNHVRINTSVSKIYDMGVIRLPFLKGQATNAFMGGQALRIQASRTGGTGGLTCTKFILIPRSEGMLHFKGGSITSANPAYVWTHPNGQVEGYWHSSGQPGESLEVNPHNWGMPVGAVRCFAAAQRNGQYYEGDNINLTFRTVQRWRTLKQV